MKTLVTGAAGFIGSHVVRALLAAGHEVRALHLPREDLRNLRGLDVERFSGDVTDRDSMDAACRGCELVFHLAAMFVLWTPDWSRLWKVNVDGTRIVLDAAKRAGVRRTIVTSSIGRFGGQGMKRQATESSPFALGPTGDRYARSKADAYEVALRAAEEQDVVLVAPCGPIGPGDVGPTPTGRLLITTATAPIVVVARSMTNFVDVRDVARGHVLAAERGMRGETYLLGHRDLWMKDIAEMALRALGLSKQVLTLPLSAAAVAARAALAWTNHVSRRPPLLTPEAVRIARLGLRADCSKAVRELGLPQSPIEDAVRDAIEWFARHGRLPEGHRIRIAWT